MDVQPKPSRSPASTRRRRAAGAPPTAARAASGRRRSGDRGAAAGHAPRSAPPLPLTAPPPTRAHRRSTAPDGDATFVLFIAALLGMVAAITLVDVVGRFWVLVPVMLVDFAATLLVMAAINRMLADEDAPPA